MEHGTNNKEQQMEALQIRNSLPGIDALSKTEVGFINARQSPKLRDLNKAEALAKILNGINLAFVETGQLPMGEDYLAGEKYLEMMSHGIYNDMTEFFPNLTIEELLLAIRSGIREKYGKYYGINVVSIHMFVGQYLADAERQHALAKKKRQEEAEAMESKKVFTPEEEEEIIYRGLCGCYQAYKETGRIFDIAGSYYDYVIRHGFIRPTRREKEEIYELATHQIKAEQALKRQSLYSRFHKPSPSDIELFTKIRAKEIVLARYFDFMKEEERKGVVRGEE